MIHSEKYKTYMGSAAWAKKKLEAINRAHCRCNRCGSWYYLEVHHKTYDRLGDELPSDLEVLCKSCHVIADGERAAQTSARAYSSGLDAWATKVYGEDENRWPNDVEDRFDRWLEKKADEW